MVLISKKTGALNTYHLLRVWLLLSCTKCPHRFEDSLRSSELFQITVSESILQVRLFTCVFANPSCSFCADGVFCSCYGFFVRFLLLSSTRPQLANTLLRIIICYIVRPMKRSKYIYFAVHSINLNQVAFGCATVVA